MDDPPSPPYGIHSRQQRELTADPSLEDRSKRGAAPLPAEEAPHVLRPKAARIVATCGDGHDLDALVDLATTEHGLVDDEVRRKACTSPALSAA